MLDELRKWVWTANEAELREANNICCDGIREFIRRKNSKLSMNFRIGDIVQFQSKRGKIITGTVERINKKTLSLTDCSDDSRGWRVGFSHAKIRGGNL